VPLVILALMGASGLFDLISVADLSREHLLVAAVPKGGTITVDAGRAGVRIRGGGEGELRISGACAPGVEVVTAGLATTVRIRADRCSGVIEPEVQVPRGSRVRMSAKGLNSN
jgi:hypothetical protein